MDTEPIWVVLHHHLVDDDDAEKVPNLVAGAEGGWLRSYLSCAPCSARLKHHLRSPSLAHLPKLISAGLVGCRHREHLRWVFPSPTGVGRKWWT